VACKKVNEYCGEVKGHFDWINDIYVDSNDSLYTFSSDGTFRQWVNGEEKMRIFAHEGKIWRAVFDEKESTFFTVAWDGWVKKWDKNNGKLLGSKQFHSTYAMALDIDQRYVFSGDWDRKLIKSTKQDLHVVNMIMLPEIPMAFKIVGDELLVGGKEGNLYVLDKKTLQIKSKISLHKSIIWKFEIFLNNFIVSYSYDGYIKLLRKKDQHWKQILEFENKDDPFMGGGVIDGLIVGGTLLGELILWDGITGEQITKWKPHNKATLVIKKKGDISYSASRDRSVVAFKVKVPMSLHSNNQKKVIINQLYRIKGSKITPVSSVRDKKGILTGYWEKKAFYCEEAASKNPSLIIENELSAINDVELTNKYGFVVSANRKLVMFDRDSKKLLKNIKLPDNPLLVATLNNQLIIAYRKGLVEKRKIPNIEENEKIGEIKFKPLKIICTKNRSVIIKGLGEEKSIKI